MKRLLDLIWFLLTGGDEAHASERYDDAALKYRVCPESRHVGPIFHHLVTTTRIEVDPKTLRPKDNAEAQIVEQFPDGWECEACGIFTNNPFPCS